MLEHNVTVALGVDAPDKALNARFDVAWVGPSTTDAPADYTDIGDQAAIDSGGAITQAQAIALASANVEKLLGIERADGEGELVATLGGELLGYGKVVGIISPLGGTVEVL